MRKHELIHASALAVGILAILASFAAGQSKPAAAPDLGAILSRLSSYDAGIASDPYWELRNFVLGIKNKPDDARLACEKALLDYLGTKASLPARTAVCRELAVIGGDASVSVLGKLLLDNDLSDMSRYALLRIPGDGVDAALLSALAGAKKDIKLGLISTLAERKAQGGAAELARLLKPGDPDIAAAAAGALAEIGGPTALDALRKALPSAPPALKDRFAEALLRISGDSKSGPEVYEAILAANPSPAVRFAATRAKIAASGAKTPALILDALASADADSQAAAIGLIRGSFDESALAPILAAFPKLSAASQVMLIAVLAEYPQAAVVKTILGAAGSEVRDVRIAAFRALEKAGDAASVDFLAQAAAKAVTVEQTAARDALSGLKGKDVDEAILGRLAAEPEPNTQAELVRAVGERKIFAGKPLAIRMAASPAAKVRREAVRAVRVIGTPSDIPALLDLYLKAADETERQNLEAAVVGLSRKFSQMEARSGAVLTRLALLEKNKDVPGRAALFGVLARIGDDSALAVLRKALGEKTQGIGEAAARALIAWPNPAAKDDVFELAESWAGATIRILALQGAVRLTALERYRAPKAVVRDLGRALKLAERPEEKKLVLGKLPDFAGPEALALVGTLLSDPAVTAEAQVALEKIKSQLVQAAKAEIQ
jgi:HEAT repeat protein